MAIALIFLFLSAVVSATETPIETDIDSTISLKTIIKLNEGDVNQKNFAYLIVSSVIDAAKSQKLDTSSIPEDKLKPCELTATTKAEVNGVLSFLNDSSVIRMAVTKKDTIRVLIAAYYIYYCDDTVSESEPDDMI